MLTSPYSRPEFDPYESNDAPNGDEVLWAAPTCDSGVDARLQLPGSKSLTNRELVLAALASTPTLLRRPLHSRDTSLMVDSLRSLGANIVEVPGDGAFGEGRQGRSFCQRSQQ